MSYAAILSRSMNIDPVNLGFGGAGKAEDEQPDWGKWRPRTLEFGSTAAEKPWNDTREIRRS